MRAVSLVSENFWRNVMQQLRVSDAEARRAAQLFGTLAFKNWFLLRSIPADKAPIKAVLSYALLWLSMPLSFHFGQSCYTIVGYKSRR